MSLVDPPGQPELPRQAKSSRAVHLLKRLGLLTGTLILLTLGAEISTRLFTETIPPLTKRDPVIGLHYLPGFAGSVYVPEAQREVFVRFNSLGFRGPDRPTEKAASTRRIAVLGDSMIASLGVNEPDTLVCQLEQMLNRSHPQWKWEVLNFGVSGASPGQELVLYTEQVSRWRPDIVLCAFFVGNDLADNCRQLSNNPRIYFDLDPQGQLFQVPQNAGRARLSSYLNRYSRFYVWQRDAVNTLLRQASSTAGRLDPGQWIFCRNESDRVAHAWKLTGKIFEAFQQEATRQGAQFAVVLLPVATQVYRDAFEALQAAAGELGPDFDWDYPDQRLGALCRAADVSSLSMTADFRAAAPKADSRVSQEWLFYQGNGHFNPQGNALGARAVHRFLTEGAPHRAAGQPIVSRLR